VGGLINEFRPNGLRVGKFPCPKIRELPAVAALLDASDWDTGVRRAEAVDEHAGRFQPPGDALRARCVSGA
jgi:hypothetical protein